MSSDQQTIEKLKKEVEELKVRIDYLESTVRRIINEQEPRITTRASASDPQRRH